MKPSLKAYFSEIGRRGGRRSRRALDSDTARTMVRVREAKRAFKRFHAQCFWSYDPNYTITARDVSWVAEQLMKNGGREAWTVGAKLCH